MATERPLPTGIREGVREGLEMKVLKAGTGSLKWVSVGNLQRSNSMNSSPQSSQTVNKETHVMVYISEDDTPSYHKRRLVSVAADP